MILAEKIMSLRKREGWSQEELAGRLGVSRQSVSKWESASSIPDITKITQMSEIFGVSTDYLLKDEVEDPLFNDYTAASGPAEAFSADGMKKRPVTLDEASEYMDLTEKTAPWTALGVALCVWSPIPLILLGGLASLERPLLSENAAGAAGVTILLVMIALAVVIFIMKSSKLGRFDYLEKEPIELQYGVEAAVLRRKEAFANVLRLSVAAGVFIILAGIAQFVAIGALAAEGSMPVQIAVLCVMLFMIGCSVYLFVKSGMISESYKKLLQDDDYSLENKAVEKKVGWFPGVYWCVVTAIYLGWSFISGAWGSSWIIWPLAGVLFAAVYGVIQAVVKKKM